MWLNKFTKKQVSFTTAFFRGHAPWLYCSCSCYFPTFNMFWSILKSFPKSPFLGIPFWRTFLISCWYFQNPKFQNTNHGYAAFFRGLTFCTRKKSRKIRFLTGFFWFAEFQGEASSDPFFGGGKGCSKQKSSQLTTTTRWWNGSTWDVRWFKLWPFLSPILEVTKKTPFKGHENSPSQNLSRIFHHWVFFVPPKCQSHRHCGHPK